jgi:hypothetical protein
MVRCCREQDVRATLKAIWRAADYGNHYDSPLNLRRVQLEGRE